MLFRALVAISALVATGAAIANSPGQSGAVTPFSADLGGVATVHDALTRGIFMQTQPNLPEELARGLKVGRDFFLVGWTPSFRFDSADGLGPIFSAQSCESCHQDGGRGSHHTRIMRLSIPPQNATQEAMLADHLIREIGDPVYGIQLQERGIPGIAREGGTRIDYTEFVETLADGTEVILREPHYTLNGLYYGPAHEDVMISPRLGPPLIGVGLLEAIPADTILAMADPNDLDGDGISGRAQYVFDAVSGEVMLGRFGWKAGGATLRAQTAAAFLNDIGVSTSVFPSGSGECTAAQTKCVELVAMHPNPRGEPEAPDLALDRLTQFISVLGVPARRDVEDPLVMRGQEVFMTAGCGGCHTPSAETGDTAEAYHAGQTIWPFTDLLLHDMGERLADNRPEGVATGTEWRTAPLWGLGLADLVVNGTARYLHDGRANSVTEAILWHGGEAQGARDVFAALEVADREALLAFLASL